jgi:membrane-anchored protein YejM (alkaline phosphatase superfamily)
MDTQVEKVLGQLKSSGLLNNTIVILTSDHGESFNEYNNNIWGHCYGYMDTLIHVPLIIHWPKKSSFTIKGQTTHYDLAATVIKYLNQQKLEMNYTIGHDLFHPQKREFIISGSYIDSAIISSNLTTVFNSSGKLLLFNPKGKLVENIKPNKIHIAKALKRMKQFYQE